MSTDQAHNQPIPGLEEVRGREADDLEQAVRRTIAELHRQGHVREVDAGRAALALELAQVLAIKKATKRASTYGNDARVLMELLDGFAEAVETEVDDDLAAAMAAWSEEVGKHGNDTAADASTEVRHGP